MKQGKQLQVTGKRNTIHPRKNVTFLRMLLGVRSLFPKYKEEKRTMVKKLGYSFAIGTLIFGIGIVNTSLFINSAMATHEEERSGSTTRTDRGATGTGQETGGTMGTTRGTERETTEKGTAGGSGSGRETGPGVGVPGTPGPGQGLPEKKAPGRPGATGDTTGPERGTTGGTSGGASGTERGTTGGGTSGGTGGGAPGGTGGGTSGGGTGGDR